MRCIIFLWIALTFSKSQAQGHLTIYHGYQPTRILPNGQGHPITSLTTIHHCRIQQLATTRRYLEDLTTRLRLELQELQARRHHAYAQLQESRNQDRCKCENADVLLTPTPSPAQSRESDMENHIIENTSWQLEPTVSTNSLDVEVTGDHEPTTARTSFLSSTVFVLAVFLMAVPVACVIGFVLLGKRRRRQHYTHA